jgi:hypothetical protein
VFFHERHIGMSNLSVSKNDVQEYLMKRGWPLPRYETMGYGPFYSRVTVSVPGYPDFTATSLACLNKKAAELEAANRLWNTPEFVAFKSGQLLSSSMCLASSSDSSVSVPAFAGQMSISSMSSISSAAKNILQECLAKKRLKAPVYVTNNDSPFVSVVTVSVPGYSDFTATSAGFSTKKAAELDAASRLLALPSFAAFQTGKATRTVFSAGNLLQRFKFTSYKYLNKMSVIFSPV